VLQPEEILPVIRWVREADIVSDVAASSRRMPGAWPASAIAAGDPPDVKRVLQLALAAIWMLDAVLQYQSFMFSKAFGQMLAVTAPGNPGVVASPINWNAHLIEHHLILLNTIFATTQLAIAVGIAYRPSVKIALAASIAWGLGVWWFGEGLGEVLTGSASPVNGAPGAVLIYALIAVLLWPTDRDRAAPFVAARAIGLTAARLVWLAFWAAMVFFTLQSANLTPQGLHDLISGMASGEPGWLASLDNGAAAALAHNGVAGSAVLAAAFALIAASIFLPTPAARAAIVLAFAVAAFIWVVGEAFGGILTGGGTDPNSGPLLALFALLYWPGLGSGQLGAAGMPGRPAPAVAATGADD